MAHKRPFEDQLPNEVSSKYPRQMGEGDLYASHVDMFSLKEASAKHYSSGEGSFMVNGLEGQDICANGRTPGFPNGNEEDNDDASIPRSLSLSPWAACSTSEEEYALDLVAPLPFTTTEYFSFDRAASSPVHADDLYSLLDYAPRKSVPIGPDHQADIPSLPKTSSIRDENDVAAGINVIPRNDFELRPYNRISIGAGRTDCNCEDMESVRCVKQHIMEAREKLMTTLGQEAFVELGFCEMGEVVSEKWSKDEQKLFHKVVQCNPISLGKNFWNVLSAVFPSHTQMELVSYYFNVFMLQKRGEQNRYDPTNIDSDNDEWQLSGDEEDSAVESPVCHDDDDNISNGHNTDYPFDDPVSHGDDISSKLDRVENNAHDGSYTSSDSGAPSELPPGNQECGAVWQDFILEPCDAKTWDRYTTCPKDEVDFLPTCSMIQEVFGDGTLDTDLKTG